MAEALARMGKRPEDCVALLGGVTDARSSQAEVFAWKDALRAEGDALERLLLTYATSAANARVEALPVHAGVKTILRKEFQNYAKPPGAGPTLAAGTDPFVVACKIATLRRFPAGPIDWVISGLPRSWFTKMPCRDVPRAMRYAALEFGGLRPAFYVHVAPAPRNRSLVIEKEVRKAYYRMAQSLALQPEAKGILCAGWFHDPQALREAPHLAALNEPYLAHGGRVITTIGPAPENSGFLDHNPERRKRYESGEFRPRLTLAMWPRTAAVAWARAHPELDG
jgi:hypothetical protein